MADSEAPSRPQDAASTTAAPQPPDTLGQLLRETRLKHDLTLEQLATELRIESKHLNALEENRFEHIGVPVFVKGYLKQYGLRLGLDVSDLLAMYYKQTTLPDVQIQPSRTIKLHDERQITSWVLAVIVLLVLIVGLAVWWWSGGDLGNLRRVPVTQSEPADSVPPPAEPVPAPVPLEAPPPRPERTLPVEDGGPAFDPPAPGAEPAQAPAIAEVAAADDADNTRAAPPVTIPLEFAFEQESWSEVTDARGERLLFGLSSAGRNVTVRGEPPFAIVLGNANAVRLTVDGQPYEIPTVGRQGNLARFAVDIAEE
jgi:cytoskeleton protein RodZ